MRRIIVISVVTIFLLVISYFVFGIVKKTRERSIIEEQISKLPSFSFTTLQDTLFNSLIIKEGPVLIVRFHPECEHCQYEISELFRSKITESGVKVLLITGADKDMVISFLDQFSISQRESVITLLDTAFIFNEIFGADIVPSNYIYNKDLELVKVLNGEYKIETILKYLGKSE